jgi:hypothetical protein
LHKPAELAKQSKLKSKLTADYADQKRLPEIQIAKESKLAVLSVCGPAGFSTFNFQSSG